MANLISLRIEGVCLFLHFPFLNSIPFRKNWLKTEDSDSDS